jgi:hypothetical protein
MSAMPHNMTFMRSPVLSTASDIAENTGQAVFIREAMTRGAHAQVGDAHSFTRLLAIVGTPGRVGDKIPVVETSRPTRGDLPPDEGDT